MTDTSRPMKDTIYIPAKTVITSATTTTAEVSSRVRSVPTSRYDGQIKLRLAPREMPDRTINASTE